MSKPILYYDELSPPSRGVLLAIKELGLDIELRVTSLLKGDHLNPEFLKINPTHTVPALDDNGTYIFDSHAIMSYLVEKYAKNDKLYPKDLVDRARVHEALYLDTGVLFARLRFLFEPILYYGSPDVPQDKIDYLDKGYGLLESVLTNRKYVAGENLTIGDFACISSITSIEIVLPINKEKYPKLADWFRRMKEIPYLDAVNQNGLDGLKNNYLRILGENRQKVGK